MNINNRIVNLRRIEQEAKAELEHASGGRHYEGKEHDIETLQLLIRDARMARLKLELDRN